MNCFFGKSMLTFCALSIVSFTASALGEDEHSVAGLKGQFPASSDEKIASGSGVLIGPQTVLTNRHIVMDDSDRAYHGFRVSTGPKYETSDSVRARAVFVSEDYDLAILELETPRGNPRIQILDDVAPLGTKISAFGFPLGSSVGIGLTLTGGQIGRLPVPWQPSDTNEEKSIKKALWHDAVIASGSSGGPIFSERGVLVGLNYAFLKKSSHALSVPGSAIASFLRSTKCNTEITLITNGSLPTTTPSSDIQNNVVYVEVFGEDRKQPIMNDLSMEVLGLKDTRSTVQLEIEKKLKLAKPQQLAVAAKGDLIDLYTETPPDQMHAGEVVRVRGRMLIMQILNEGALVKIGGVRCFVLTDPEYGAELRAKYSSSEFTEVSVDCLCVCGRPKEYTTVSDSTAVFLPLVRLTDIVKKSDVVSFAKTERDRRANDLLSKERVSTERAAERLKRVFAYKSGKYSAEATYVGIEDGKACLIRSDNSREVKVEVSMLRDEDQEWIKQNTSSAKIYGSRIRKLFSVREKESTGASSHKNEESP